MFKDLLLFSFLETTFNYFDDFLNELQDLLHNVPDPKQSVPILFLPVGPHSLNFNQLAAKQSLCSPFGHFILVLLSWYSISESHPSVKA